jgi:hypothetical protein
LREGRQELATWSSGLSHTTADPRIQCRQDHTSSNDSYDTGNLEVQDLETQDLAAHTQYLEAQDLEATLPRNDQETPEPTGRIG